MSADAPPELRRDDGSSVRVSDMLALAEWMREVISESKDDLRIEIVARQDVLMAKIDAVISAQRDYTAIHAQDHLADAASMKEWRGRMNGYVDAARIAKARQEGLLGAVQFMFNLIGRNWRGLAILAGTVGIVVGNVHVNLS